MKTIEIITIRMDLRREGPFLREVRAVLDATSLSDDGVDVELYRHATVQTDLSIHLRSEKLQTDGLPSSLGQRLASALREFGPISHSTWFSEE